MMVATGLTIVWEEMGRPFDLNAVLVSLPASVITLVVVSLLVPNRRAAKDAAQSPEPVN